MILAVLTCERPKGTNYLAVAVRHLSAQPWPGRRVVWSDGPAPPVEAPRWDLIERPRRGPPNTHAVFDLFEYAVAEGQGLLLVQDDTRPCDGALPYIQRMGPAPGAAFTSWFDNMSAGSGAGWPIAMYVRANRVLSAQARSYPLQTLRDLVAYRRDRRADYDAHAGGQDDATVAAALSDRMAAVHAPSLFEHIGSDSALGGGPIGGSRASASFGVDVGSAFAHVTPADLWGEA